ncbi:MAG TPA: protein phosphatase 2C domain-containing protein, partial [Ktedonobacteraceae bacterium]|nr:protein phosphatase 2C domain-containing protein [Ktedonobacteraceae bacterium]
LLDALEAAHYRVEDVAERTGTPVGELQSTLLVFLVMPWDENRLLIASSQIGDGALFVLQQKPDNRWNWLQQPQIQSAGNEVQPFIRATPDEWVKYFRCDLIEHVACIMGMTDGTADAIEPPRPTRENPNPDSFARVQDFYQRIILPALICQSPGEELVNNLGYKKRSSFDDRTVVCLYR